MTDIDQLSLDHGIDRLDVLMIALNTEGVELADTSRARFWFYPYDHNKALKLSVPVVEGSEFRIEKDTLLQQDMPLGKVESPLEDVCEDIYFRNKGRALTLNSNRRSRCRGCRFCGAYKLPSDEEDLTDEKRLAERAKSIDIGRLEHVTVVTGCFPDEEQAL